MKSEKKIKDRWRKDEARTKKTKTLCKRGAFKTKNRTKGGTFHQDWKKRERRNEKWLGKMALGTFNEKWSWVPFIFPTCFFFFITLPRGILFEAIPAPTSSSASTPPLILYPPPNTHRGAMSCFQPRRSFSGRESSSSRHHSLGKDDENLHNGYERNELFWGRTGYGSGVRLSI